MSEASNLNPPSKLCARLAIEGMPVYAIARAVQLEGEEVRDILKQALDTGVIGEMPRDDWPGASRWSARQPAFSARLDPEEIHVACARVFKTTKSETVLLSTLLRRPQCSKQTLHNAQQGTGADGGTDIKIVDVFICKLRKKLKWHDITIKTLHQYGYFLEPEDRAKTLHLLGLSEETA